ncbi:helix-turn-helix domain-containing protein [Pseudoalteromonas sp. MTN2-4]|uniref:helix-turn-helix domain-containing protein n=1 Tax=Pseudoalteromonas sp. MTN2-4 TaxID=3056555 RepID=UPI0036F2814C
MSQMTTQQVAEFLEVKVERVKRLARENLLIAKGEDAQGDPVFDQIDVEKYKELAKRLGGI